MDKDIIKANCIAKEELLSKYATKSNKGIRIKKEEEGIRPSFFRDSDRIFHSLSYSRYIDKTQVYSFQENDHISKRIIHVSLVSKIARSIGRLLNLNEDLIESIAIGHDIGHAPLGHFGESCLNKISLRELGIPFMHNLNSVRTYMALEKNGDGLNLTIQTLNGIMAHNGEMLSNIYKPAKKTKEEFLHDYLESEKDANYAGKVKPMTLEGCVVRISDIIAYVGRDIEDAIRLGKLASDDLPPEITNILGNTNRNIVNTIVNDIVSNSYNKPYIKLSDDVFKALNNLKRFNYEKIYNKSSTKQELDYYQAGFEKLYKKYLSDLKSNNKESLINSMFLNGMNAIYINNTTKEKIVIDFIAGMTDDFFMNEYKKIQ